MTLACWAAGDLGLRWAIVQGAGSPVWPAAGVAFAGLLLGGIRLWPAVFLGRLAAAISTQSVLPLSADLMIALANTLGAALPVLALERTGGLDKRLGTLKDVSRLLIIGAGLGAIAAATLVAVTLWMYADLTTHRAAATWLNVAVGDFVGIAVIGTLLVASAGGWTRPSGTRRVVHLLAVIGATAAASMLLFTLTGSQSFRTWHLVPVLVWAALAFQVRGAALALAIASAFAVWGTSHGLGPIHDLADHPETRIALLQQFLAVTAIPILLLAAGADERKAKEAIAAGLSALHESEARLRESEARLRAIVDTAVDAIVIIDETGIIRSINGALTRIFGYSAEEAVGRNVRMLMPDAHAVAHDGYIDAYKRTGKRQIIGIGREVEGKRKDESTFPLDLSIAEWRDARGTRFFTGIMRDITARHEAEAALRQSEATSRSMLNAIPQMVWSTLPDGYHDFYNDRWYEFTGVPMGSTDGEGWNEMFHPDDQGPARERWRVSLATGEPYEVEYRLRNASGEYRWTLGRALPVRDERGTIVRWMGTCTDIEDLKRTESHLEAALQAQEALLYEVNHRIKNNLQMIAGLLALQAGQTRDPEAKRSLAEARSRIEVVGSIHRSLYQTASHNEVEIGGFIRALATNTVASLSDGERIKLELYCEGEIVLPLAKAVPVALIVSELLTNAAKYAFSDGAGGLLRLTVERTSNEVLVEVADDGRGLPQEFEPARSSGVGMRIIGALTKQLRAKFEVVRPQQGATFRVHVPL